MASLNWTDGIGAASLSNAFIHPGSRFKNWTPANKPFGEHSTNLGTGQRNVTAFRDDLTVALEIPGIPNSDQPKMLRLQMHLKRGGSVTLDASPDTTIPTFGACKLAPGADVTISGPDKQTLEYTFSTVLRGSNVLPFPPGVVPGDFYIWQRADAPLSVGLPGDTDLLSLYFDWSNSPGGNSSAQATEIWKPEWRLAIQNGLPGVYFDPSTPGPNDTKRMSFPADCLKSLPEAELFMVLRSEFEPGVTVSLYGTGPVEMGSGHVGGLQNTFYPYDFGPTFGHVYEAFGSGTVHDLGDPGIDLMQTHLFNVSSRPNEYIGRFNGVETVNDPVNSVGFPDTAIFNTDTQIGTCRPDAIGGYFGWQFETLITSPVRTPTQRALWEAYTLSKWAY